MSRKLITNEKVDNEVKNDFKSMVDEYVKLKSEEKVITKQTKKLNEDIKKYLIDNNLTRFDGDIGSVELSSRESVSFDEEKLIAFFKESGKADMLVKTKEYVDYDAFESALYHEEFSKDEVKKMDEFKVVKVSKVLNTK